MKLITLILIIAQNVQNEVITLIQNIGFLNNILHRMKSCMYH